MFHNFKYLLLVFYLSAPLRLHVAVNLSLQFYILFRYLADCRVNPSYM